MIAAVPLGLRFPAPTKSPPPGTAHREHRRAAEGRLL
jgi:hypothetical protein